MNDDDIVCFVCWFEFMWSEQCVMQRRTGGDEQEHRKDIDEEQLGYEQKDIYFIYREASENFISFRSMMIHFI